MPKPGILTPLFLSLPPALLLWWLLPLDYNAYRAEKTRPDRTTTEILAWADIDHDGNSDMLELGTNGPDGRINMLNNKGEMFVSWHFKGVWRGTPRVLTGDWNHDGYPELSLFSQHNDSITLRIWDAKTRDASSCFVSTIPLQNGKPDFNVGQLADFQDLNGDGSPELVFSIMAGYARKPRKIMAYDYKHHRLTVSPDLGNMIFGMTFFQTDTDPEPEIALSSFAGANYPPDDTSTQFNDNRAWSMALDNNLLLLYHPIPIGQASTYLYQQGASVQNESFITLLAEHRSTVNRYPTWYRIGTSGVILFSKEFRNLPAKKGYLLLNSTYESITVLGYQDGIAYKLDSTGRITDQTELGTPVVHPWLQNDLDGDGRKEQLFMASTGQQLLIFRDGFKHRVTLNVTSVTLEPGLSFGMLYKNGKPDEFVIQNQSKLYFFRYGRNPYYYYKYPALLLCVILFTLFIRIIQGMQKRRTERRMQLEKDFQSLKLQTVRNQIDPHFALNFLNNVNYLIHQSDPETASRYLAKFSRLLHESLSGDQEITRSLEKELEFVRNYLEIEQLRYPDKFEFAIHIADHINLSARLPAMNIQLFAENALKHGIKPKTGKGSVNITVRSETGYLVIDIADDGVGRKAAARIGEGSTGKGLVILNTLYTLYNQSHTNKIRYETEDLLTESGEAAGTRVRVWVPEGFSYE